MLNKRSSVKGQLVTTEVCLQRWKYVAVTKWLRWSLFCYTFILTQLRQITCCCCEDRLQFKAWRTIVDWMQLTILDARYYVVARSTRTWATSAVFAVTSMTIFFVFFLKTSHGIHYVKKNARFLLRKTFTNRYPVMWHWYLITAYKEWVILLLRFKNERAIKILQSYSTMLKNSHNCHWF